MDLYCSTMGAEWTGPRRPIHDRASYKAPWSTVAADLQAEAEHLGADEILILLDVDRSDLRVDRSAPKANTETPAAVIVWMPSTKHGPLRWQCDRWDRWRDNVRAIGLTLQRLRLIDELGVATGGQQYTGWQAFGPGRPMIAGLNDPDFAWSVLRRQADPDVDPLDLKALYRSASKNTHPDGNGTAEAFGEVDAAYRLLSGAR